LKEGSLPFSPALFIFPLLLFEYVGNKICETIILPVVGGSLNWGEEYSFKMYENGVLRRIFGHKRVEVRGECRKLDEHIE
jgi:hypothetical protein